MRDIEWPNPAMVLAVHDAMIEHDGGLSGLRDRAPLEAGLGRPLQSSFGDDLSPGVPRKAVRLAVVLTSNGLDLALTSGGLADAALSVASGEWDVEAWYVRVQERVQPPSSAS